MNVQKYVWQHIMCCFLLLLPFLFCGCDKKGGTEPKQEPIILPDGYEERYHNDMRYGLFIPPTYDANKAYPLVLRLHGSTDTTSWNLGWYNDPVQTEDPVFVLTPKTLDPSFAWGATWYSTHTPDMLNVLEIVELTKQEFNIDTTRIYVHGSSMGGFGVFSVISKEPGMFAAAVSICGGGDTNNCAMMAGTPLWIFHGSDDDVVPARMSRNIYQAILDKGGKLVRYTEYPGVKHDSWNNAWDEPTLIPWILAQKRGVWHENPDSVSSINAQILSSNQAQVSWQPPVNESSVDKQVWYYKVFRDNLLIAEIDHLQTAYIDTTHLNSGNYSYSISTVNFFFKESARSHDEVVSIP